MSSNGSHDSSDIPNVAPLTEERKQEIEEKLATMQTLYSDIQDCLAKADEGVFVADKVMDIVEQSSNIIESERNCENTSISLPLMDVKVLSAAVESLKLNVDSIDVNPKKFDPKDFVDRMLPLLEAGNMDTLLTYSENCIRAPVPSYPFLYGTFPEEKEESPKKVRKSRQSQAEPMEAEKKQPEQVLSLEKEETEIQKILQQMMKVLREQCAKNCGEPISFYRFIVDPHSFSRTVENMFHVSFLVRDGEVFLEYDEEQELLVLSPLVGNGEEASGINPDHREQIILEMTMDDWEYLIDEFEIEEPMFTPTRD